MYLARGPFGTFTAEITYGFDLYSPDGALVSSWTASGSGQKGAGLTFLGDARPIVGATESAMQDAAREFMTGFSTAPEVLKWLEAGAPTGALAPEAKREQGSAGPAVALSGRTGAEGAGTSTESASAPGPESEPVFRWEVASQRAKLASKWYLSGLFGLVRAADNPGQINFRATVGMVAANVGYSMNRNFAAEGELSYTDREFAVLNRTTLLPGAVENNIDIQMVGVTIAGKGVYPAGSWRPFVGAGAGFYNTKLYVQTVPNPGRFENPYSYTGQQKTVFGYYFTGGADYVFTEHHLLGLEYRRIIVDVDFEEFTNGRVDIGGDTLALDYRYHF